MSSLLLTLPVIAAKVSALKWDSPYMFHIILHFFTVIFTYIFFSCHHYNHLYYHFYYHFFKYHFFYYHFISLVFCIISSSNHHIIGTSLMCYLLISQNLVASISFKLSLRLCFHSSSYSDSTDIHCKQCFPVGLTLDLS